jgi:DNA-binding NarL/FixJ family response regulator
MNEPARATRIQVAISHHDPYVATGIAALLRSRADFAVLAGDSPEAGSADVLVADHARGLQPAPPRRRGARPVAVLVVSDQRTSWQIRRAVDAGVRGYLLQDTTAEELSEAVRSIAAGRRYLSCAVADLLLDSLVQAVPTARELDVLQLIARGLSNKDIGRLLGIGEGTVKTHVKAILAKLGESTRIGAIAEALRRGLLPGEAPALPAPPLPAASAPAFSCA